MAMLEKLIILQLLIKHPQFSLLELEKKIKENTIQETTLNAQEINALEFFFESKEWTGND